ncbi:MAG: DUF445 family protein [Clostridiales bacterium]|nr:DUF445 family protein [Clostridiales bacterium]
MLGKLAGPIIGALIGYCTNYIAVKMLFYPKKEIRIWGHKLPFTPGAIPKGKPRIAKAIGNIVASDLLTEEDIKQKLSSQETEKAVVDQIMQGFFTDLHTCISQICPSELDYNDIKTKLVSELSTQILDAAQHMHLDELIVQEAGKVVKAKVKGTMLEMLLNDDMLNSMLQPVGSELINYMNEKGPDLIRAEIESKIDVLEEKSVLDICNHLDISEEAVRKMLTAFYQKAMNSVIGKLLGNLDIAGIIEEKINAMDVDSLENMVLTVMKKELDMIINLGALVGAVLGVLNIFIS